MAFALVLVKLLCHKKKGIAFAIPFSDLGGAPTHDPMPKRHGESFALPTQKKESHLRFLSVTLVGLPPTTQCQKDTESHLLYQHKKRNRISDSFQ